jgi:ribose transport system permease protein
MTMSLRSTALEPGPDDYKGSGLARLWHTFKRTLPVYGLVYLTVALIVFFSVLLPDTFPTPLNFRLIASGKAVLAMLALGVTVPMAAGKIDVSIGFAVGLWHIVVLVLMERAGLPMPLAIVIVLMGGVAVGIVNGLLVELAQVDAFVATLGTGTLLYAMSLLLTGGAQVVDTNNVVPTFFWKIASTDVLGVPGPFVFVVVLAIVMWVVFDYLPIGRYLYASGANPRAAELNGIPRRRYVLASFIVSGTLPALAGVFLASRLQVGQANISNDYLLPALVAAFLGSTTIRPGRVNPWGTVIGIVILAVGISGIEQKGASFWVEPAFNGATLVIAITIASIAGRRRVTALERHQGATPPAAPTALLAGGPASGPSASVSAPAEKEHSH